MLSRGLVVLLLAAAAAGARANAFDPVALARFDHGYQRCEQLDAQMRGGRDAAWLAVWRVRSDEAGLARLARLREGEAYKREARRVARAPAPAQAASSPVAQQCQALQAERQKAQARQAGMAARAASKP